MAITANRHGVYRSSGGKLRDFVVFSGQTIFEGTLVALTADGDAFPLIDEGEPATDPLALLIGVGVEEVTGDGTLTVRVDIGGAEILVDHDTGSLTIANIGDEVFSGSDEGSVDDATGSQDDIPVGRIVEVPTASTCWVGLRPYPTQS